MLMFVLRSFHSLMFFGCSDIMPLAHRMTAGYKLRRRCVPVHVVQRASKPSSFLNVSNPLDLGFLPKHLMGVSLEVVFIQVVGIARAARLTV